MGIKDMFWKDTSPKDTTPKGSLTGQQTVTKYYAPPAPGGITENYASEPLKGSIDVTSAGEFDKYFTNIMKQADLPGPDYFEFAKALDGLKNAGLPEEQKILAVFAGFQAQGVSPQQLVEAANKYIDILNSKKTTEFDASVKSAEMVIAQKSERVAQLSKDNLDLAEKLKANNQEIATLGQEGITLQGKLESKKTTFNMSFNNFIAKIQKDIQSIQKYLINGTITK